MKHQKVIKRKSETERSRIIYKYALMKRFHHEYQLKVYMYYFMCVYPEKITEEDYFSIIKTFLKTTRKCQPQDQYQSIGLDLLIFVQNIMS